MNELKQKIQTMDTQMIIHEARNLTTQGMGPIGAVGAALMLFEKVETYPYAIKCLNSVISKSKNTLLRLTISRLLNRLIYEKKINPQNLLKGFSFCICFI